MKLEVLTQTKHLYPDMEETLRALKLLIADGFSVMVYATDDPVMCKKAEDLGAAAIMPDGAQIGSGLGVQNAVNIRLIVEQSSVPVLVDAGVGTASDAALAMELGCDAVLMNTAIAEAKDPIRMARAMKHAVIAGREAYLAGRMAKRLYADPVFAARRADPDRDGSASCRRSGLRKERSLAESCGRRSTTASRTTSLPRCANWSVRRR